ncbi:MAG: sensor histidine kinase [Pseudomonadota bacterium]
MNLGTGIIGETGLQYFGKMSALISHEIKNVLAIINENAGLLEDYTMMAEKGMPIDSKRLKIASGKIMAQIQRAERIIKNMNKFAHSVDENIRAIDLSEVIDLVVALSAKFISMHNVKIELNPTLEQVSITTSPFFIENLLWRCLNFAVDSIGQGETIGIMVEEMEKGAEIKFTGIQDIGDSQPDSFPGDAEKALLKTLKAEVKTDLMCGELRLSFPKDITK